MATLGKLLIGAGALLAVLGLLLLAATRLGLPLGRLPGDVVVRRRGWTLYIPWASMLLLSLVLTLAIHLLRRR